MAWLRKKVSNRPRPPGFTSASTKAMQAKRRRRAPRKARRK